MKAIVFPRFGSPDVLRLKEVDKPVPKDNEVLVRVHAASLNALDRHSVRSRPLFVRILTRNGLRRPKDPRLGVDLAGTVEAVGKSVTQFRVGDEVFGRGGGAFAEYACARENALVSKPSNLTFEQAAAVPIAALTALQAVRDKGQIQPGQQVLINGAGGGVGTFAVQFAKALGAEVTAVCGTRNVEMMRSIGVDHVLDYTKADFTKGRRKQRQRYDVILGVNGYRPLRAYRRALRRNGRYVMVGASVHLGQALFQGLLLGPLFSKFGSKKMGALLCKPTQADLAYIRELLESGKVVPVIDRRYPLAETAEALRHMEEAHTKGKIVITV